MRPVLWSPPVEPSTVERSVIRLVRRAKLFVFLREHRHELFDEAFQTELAQTYMDSVKGQPPVAPAQLALATILQAYTGVSDDEVIEATVMDRRWQLALDCMDVSDPPFSKGTLVGFRKRLIAANLDRRLIERTVQIAVGTKAFGARALRGALDSSPLWGAGRAEDTYNLMGHALRKALGVIADRQGRGPAATGELAHQAGAPILAGSSLKAALDLDWDDPGARDQALAMVLSTLDAVEAFVAGQEDPGAARAVALARTIEAQDVTRDQTGAATLRRGVAKDRRISIEDPDMRHGRKSRSNLFNGYKRHVLRDLDTGLIRAVGITAANVAEAAVTDDIADDLHAQHAVLAELHIDRAYLSSNMVRDRADDLTIFCKAWRVRNNGRFPKTDFNIDFTTRQLTCPNQIVIAFEVGKSMHFPKATCAACPLRTRCTASTTGVVSASTPTNPCLSSCANARKRRPAEPNYANAPKSNTPSRTSGTGKENAPDTATPAKTCSTYAASPSSTTSTSSPDNPPPRLLDRRSRCLAPTEDRPAVSIAPTPGCRIAQRTGGFKARNISRSCHIGLARAWFCRDGYPTPDDVNGVQTHVGLGRWSVFTP